MAPLLADWEFRGLCEPIRYLLYHQNVKFEDKRYQFSETGPECWKNQKFNLNLDFPNLPYYIDGDMRITQSLAILRHLAKKHNLAGKTECEKVKAEVVEQELIDFRYKFLQAIFGAGYQDRQAELVKNSPELMQKWAKFLGNRKFLIGDSITYVDFIAYEVFNFYEFLIPGVLKDFLILNDYQRRFEKLPELQNYLKSPKYKRWPLVGPMTEFGGKGDIPAHMK